MARSRAEDAAAGSASAARDLAEAAAALLGNEAVRGSPAARAAVEGLRRVVHGTYGAATDQGQGGQQHGQQQEGEVGRKPGGRQEGGGGGGPAVEAGGVVSWGAVGGGSGSGGSSSDSDCDNARTSGSGSSRGGRSTSGSIGSSDSSCGVTPVSSDSGGGGSTGSSWPSWLWLMDWRWGRGKAAPGDGPAGRAGWEGGGRGPDTAAAVAPLPPVLVPPGRLLHLKRLVLRGQGSPLSAPLGSLAPAPPEAGQGQGVDRVDVGADAAWGGAGAGGEGVHPRRHRAASGAPLGHHAHDVSHRGPGHTAQQHHHGGGTAAARHGPHGHTVGSHPQPSHAHSQVQYELVSVPSEGPRFQRLVLGRRAWQDHRCRAYRRALLDVLQAMEATSAPAGALLADGGQAGRGSEGDGRGAGER